MLKEVPLTSEQRKFATKHHNLIYSFLNENHLPEDEYYDVVVFGYLRAVRRYFAEDNLKSFSFTTIAWSCMRCDLMNYYKTQNCQKRNAEIVSIHVSLYDGDLPLEQTISAPDTLMQQFETELLLHDLAKRVSLQQMDVRMKSNGYGVRDIARSQKTTIKQVRELLENAHSALLELCCE
ncbi:sigma-70 family RNA polymerase sigma factor [Caproiciproducens sp. R1]|uniref:sigma-70 family RNA polymerase sigma factor n=1 Tax=Caproiciproducens sp. R1 TaxID=3435000 RepID=UPI004033CDC1